MSRSKAKSGMSATRQFFEHVVLPPNTFSGGANTWTSNIRDGRGHAEYHIAAVNDTAFTLQVQHSWRTSGVFTEDQTVPSVLDPVSGKHVADIVSPVTKRYLKVLVTIPAPGLANFELGWYFQPRASGPTTVSGGGGGGSVVSVGGNQQVQHIETETALIGSGSFTSTARDYLNYESMGVSVFIERDTADTNVDVTIEHSKDGTTNWRTVEVVNCPVTAAAPTYKLDRVYAVTRRYYRVKLENKTANALKTTDLVVMQKPIS